MSIVISGVLLDPLGQPVAQAQITLTATTNSLRVLRGFSCSVPTDSAGRYTLALEAGSYAVSVAHQGRNFVYGAVTIDADSVPSSLNVLLQQQVMEQQVTPEVILYFRQIQQVVAEDMTTVQQLSEQANQAAAQARGSKRAAVAAENAASHSAQSAERSQQGASAAKTAAEQALHRVQRSAQDAEVSQRAAASSAEEARQSAQAAAQAATEAANRAAERAAAQASEQAAAQLTQIFSAELTQTQQHQQAAAASEAAAAQSAQIAQQSQQENAQQISAFLTGLEGALDTGIEAAEEAKQSAKSALASQASAMDSARFSAMTMLMFVGYLMEELLSSLQVLIKSFRGSTWDYPSLSRKEMAQHLREGLTKLAEEIDWPGEIPSLEGLPAPHSPSSGLGRRTLLFSGDIGNGNIPLLENPEAFDEVIIISTDDRYWHAAIDHKPLWAINEILDGGVTRSISIRSTDGSHWSIDPGSFKSTTWVVKSESSRIQRIYGISY